MAKDTFEKAKVEELNRLLVLLKNVHWLKSNINWEANFINQKDKDTILNELQKKLVAEVFNKINNLK